MYRRRNTSREKRRRRRQYWRKPSRFSMKGGAMGGKRRARRSGDNVAGDAAVIAFATHKGSPFLYLFLHDCKKTAIPVYKPARIRYNGGM